MFDQKKIRNFCIVAHIDHGKSTLSDRLIEKTRAVSERLQRTQMTDNMDIERERGITIKSQAVTISYTAQDGEQYQLNFVDTPGHVDFSYEVSRAIASCEGALLLVDATQGVESQTLSNMYLALEHDLTILPVINKIDLPAADIEAVKHQIDNELGLDSDTAIAISAKTGQNIDALFEAIVQQFPPPAGNPNTELKALIFDCHYDVYRGVIVHVRVFDGCIKTGMTVRFMNSKSEYKVEETGVFVLGLVKNEGLYAGEVGYIIAGIKTVSDVAVGDTVTDAESPCDAPLHGFKEVKPVVFSSIYPMDTNDYEELRDAFERLKLNDASLTYEKDSSVALGNGFRCGFLGLLHMDVIKDRLEREYNLALITTAPNVIYEVVRTNGDVEMVDNPSLFPPQTVIDHVEEPFVNATIIVPKEYVGPVMELSQEKRGEYANMTYLDENRVMLHYSLPLSEIIFDYFDRLKSVSRGYASLDYELSGYRPSDMVKVDILLNGDPVDALSAIVHRDRAQVRGRALVEKLRKIIPRQLFEIPIQAAIGSKIIARENVSALRKDVLAKCYGGDITRKRKLLEKQKAGKKRMKQVGSVELPQEAFMAILKMDEK